MDWKIFITPLLGALIGYITNKIAVEMLFRPLKPIYIGKFHIPFTPGIIPKEKERFGKAIGDAVGKNLLTSDSIKETLLSEKIETEIGLQLESYIKSLTYDQSALKLKLEQGIGESTIQELEESIKQTVTKKITNGLITMNLGEIIAEEVLAAVNEKVQGTMIAMMMNSSLMTQMIEEITNRINLYIELHAEEKVSEFINKEFINLMEQPISAVAEKCNVVKLKDVILKIYRALVSNYTNQLLDTLNLSKIVEEKINAMEILEVEKLVLSIMEKELGAVVNLGAFIGFILGLVSVLF